MHELQTVNALYRKAVEVAEHEGAENVTKVTIRLGAFSHLSERHLREHFATAAAGSPIETAELEIWTSSDTDEPTAHEVELVSVEVE